MTSAQFWTICILQLVIITLLAFTGPSSSDVELLVRIANQVDVTTLEILNIIEQ